jgi:hypothetical protein
MTNFAHLHYFPISWRIFVDANRMPYLGSADGFGRMEGVEGICFQCIYNALKEI